MSTPMDNSASPADTRTNDERKQSPPAFLDLADSAARLGTNMPDISARVELKRMEHERQRAIQRKVFEEQMRALEQQQQQELLSLPVDSSQSLQHLAASAPTTPPRVNSTLVGSEHSPLAIMHGRLMDPAALTSAVGSGIGIDKRKSVAYADGTQLGYGLGTEANGSAYSRAGAKSMPASRRTSASEHDEDLANQLQGLSVHDGNSNGNASPLRAAPQAMSRVNVNGLGFSGVNEGLRLGGNGSGYNAGMLLDEQLDKEMQNAMRHLPIPDDDKYAVLKGDSGNKLSSSSAALDLAPLSQKSSEWPQFARSQENGAARSDRRTGTPQLGGGLQANLNDLQHKLGSAVSASATPLLQNTPGVSRRASPLNIGGLSLRTDVSQFERAPGGPGTPQSSSEAQMLGARMSAAGLDAPASAGEATSATSLSRISPSRYDSPLTFGTPQSLDNSLQSQYDVDSIYLNQDGRLNGYGLDGNSRLNGSGTTGGSTALYHHHGSRYGLAMGARMGGSDNKMNGLHGPKHKRGDIDLNRFAGTRLEDLQGEIASLCKDQHGCRYLQKKLEEGNAEHRDMIFRETFGHFAELMTDPFGNYLCQKLLEYSTDDQRNVICESVAQDLVNISLNMHGTRAVQKMIDFLSTQRQADLRYNAQIHSIIVALSLHVVVLIKDLNGNHVIQKCLNKLTPEDNQFIYNAVAANCVEVATHRHGCCVLQRCIDHASDHQRIQLVNEITYNALTLVQDPYGNYVVQYILDLNDNRFSDAVIRQFTGNVCALSVQKFSSNVIEKCIRVAEHNTRKMLIEELLNRTRLEKLLRDSFGNYCVQTALDYAESGQRALLVEGIRPILPLIRNTPYGKRIQSKLQREQMELANANGMGHYNGQFNQQAMMNMALANQGLTGQTHPGIAARGPMAGSMHPSNQLGDVYGNRSTIYGVGQNGAAASGLHNQQTPLHLQQPMHSLQTQALDGYVLQGSGTGHSHGLSSGTNGLPPGSTFIPQMPLTYQGIHISAGLNDPYQRTSYGYNV
ncbi:ARM repeat-containing protein [Fomitiporia mediterranea MF3/22]|uniref:ARM repeat-containing protein n=1 Tax=Fomitiporia mediterranea (strain MF3/22) TaxID=694068 RepID=UPI000440967B|nr:ARM repeat-containing protein [Fomitiporia mediterranea MF3/22]EJD04358.1 ARM repeat-containing protein [Fomitiporia mediterranea MF3/22]